MQGRLSRRKIAAHVASQAKNGVVPASVMHEVAAYLVETRRVRELELVVRSIEDALESLGTVVASVTTAHGLDEELRKAVKKQLGNREVYVRELIDPSVIGGVNIRTPSERLDATLSKKLTALRGAKQ